MPCPVLTKSRNIPCTSSIAGVKAISFGVFDSLKRIVTTPTGVITIATPYTTNTLARFEVRNTTTKYLENATKSADTNAKAVKGAISLMLALPVDPLERLAAEKIASTLLDRQWVCFLELRDGTTIVAGSQFGADVLSLDSDTGATGNDMNGFTVNITTNENDFASKYTLTGAGITEYATALMPLV